MGLLWDGWVAFPGFRRGWDVDEEIVKEREAVEGRD